MKAHSAGGKHSVDNFLPACKIYNNYRWHYLPQEVRWILKVGIWAKTHIRKRTKIGNYIASHFLKYETNRQRRRKAPHDIV